MRRAASGCVGPALLEGNHEIATGKNADDATIIEDREILLRSGEHEFDRALQDIAWL